MVIEAYFIAVYFMTQALGCNLSLITHILFDLGPVSWSQ
jgi:hypothetical protein